MNILFTRFPLESRFGGAEVQTLNLMEGLRDRGHTVMFWGSCPTLLREAKERKFRTHSMDLGNPPVTKWSAACFLWRQFWMKKRLINYFTTHLSDVHPDALCMLSLSEKLLLTDMFNEINVLWIEHDRVGRWLIKNPWLSRLRRLSKLATTVVVSDLSREIYRSLGWHDDDIVTIPNGIDTEKFASVAERRMSPDFPHLRIGCIARLTRDKGVDVLIDAVSDLPDVHLSILGEGREKNALELLAKPHASRIIFARETNDVPSFLASIDLLVLPSRDHDPFGLVVAEAMASGIPAICTSMCGVARHLQANEAIVVPPDDSETLRDAIRSLQKKESWLSYAQNCRHIAEQRWARSTMVERYENLFSGK